MNRQISFFEVVFLVLLALSVFAFFHGIDEPAIVALDRHYLPVSYGR